MPKTTHYQNLGEGIFCMDIGLYRQGLAACYLIQKGDRLAFIDSGTSQSVPGLLAALEALSFTPEQVHYIIPTHVHLDHAGGSGQLLAHCPNATLVTHPKGMPHMINPQNLQAGAEAVYGNSAFNRHFGALLPVPEERTRIAEHEDIIDLNGRILRYLHTPGHANHHGCIFDEQSRSCFTGDTFGISYREFDTEKGAWIFATTSPVAFDPDSWMDSLKLLKSYRPSRMLLTHYQAVEPDALWDALANSVQEMRAIALEEEKNPVTGRSERLLKTVTDCLVAQAVAHKPALDAQQAHKILQGDCQLNAQGLEVWLKRRAKAAAKLPA